MTGADILTQAMSASGTSIVFSLSGNQIMPIYDACLQPGIRIVHVRHEGAAVFMADAWAQLGPAESCSASHSPSSRATGEQAGSVLNNAGNYGVALVTAGPGFANALGGLYSALMAESPVILISGDSPVSQDGKRAFQELAQTQASAPLVKHAVRVTDVNDIVDVWHQCVDIATSDRPGPVHLSLPFDVLQAEVAQSGLRSLNKPQSPETPLISTPGLSRTESAAAPNTEQLSGIIDALASAQKPVIITGPAMTSSRLPERLGRLETTGIPVIAMESPRGLGDPSLGNVSAVLLQSDCVVLLGKLPDFTLGFAAIEKLPADSLIVVDAQAESLKQSVDLVNHPRCMAVHASPIAIAEGISTQYHGKTDHRSWCAQATTLMSAAPQQPGKTVVNKGSDSKLKEHTVNERGDDDGEHSSEALTPLQIGKQVQAAVDACEHAIVVCDGGEFGQWAQACVKADRRVINGCSGAIGGSLPQAIAAKIGHPDSVVFAMLGDGTVGFHLAELETSVREQAPIIVIIGNDSRWNAEYQIQLRDYGADRLHSCELGTDIRYDLVAVGLGCAGDMVHTESELTEALSRAIERSLHHRQSTCINVSMAGWPAPVFC